MKFGIKIWSTNKELIRLAKEHYLKGDFDYVELTAIRGSFEEELLSGLKDVPVIIHSDTRYREVNFALKEFETENLRSVQEAKKFADFFKSKYIIIHTGHDEPGLKADIANVKDFLGKNYDDRFCLENLPVKSIDLKFKFVGVTYEDLKDFDVNYYLLDFSHAIKAARSMKVDPISYIRQFLKLKPVIYHVSDGFSDNEGDEHLNIGEGDFDFKKILGLISDKDAYLTLETPKPDLTNLDNDIANINRIKKYFE